MHAPPAVSGGVLALCQRPDGELGPIGHAEFLKDRAQIGFDGAFAQVQLKSDLFIQLPFTDEFHELFLSQCETLRDRSGDTDSRLSARVANPAPRSGRVLQAASVTIPWDGYGQFTSISVHYCVPFVRASFALSNLYTLA